MGEDLMPSFAAWPTWMTFVIIIMIIGPVMRAIFGTPHRSDFRGVRKEKLRKLSSAQLNSALEERDLVIEDLQRRLTEMESRLDFTERLLAERANEPKESTPIGS